MPRSIIISRNGGQFITLPDELAFPEKIRWVEIMKRGENLEIIPKRRETRKGYFAVRWIDPADVKPTALRKK